MDLEGFALLSAKQYGTFTREQVMALGATRGGVRQQLESGRWAIELPSVYGLVGHRDSWRRRLWAAHLHAGPDSVLSHDSAGRIQGADEVFANTIDLIVPSNRNQAPPGVRWHRRTDLGDGDVVTRPGLPPMTSPARTAVDLAGTIQIARLRQFVEAGATARRFTLAEVGAVLDRVRRSGKRGVRKLATVLDDLGPGDDLPHSELEKLGDEVLELAGLPTPQHEYPLPNERGRRGFVDRCWPEARLIVEFDGRRWHHRFQQALQDADRRLEAQALGWETTPLLWEHCTSDARTDRTEPAQHLRPARAAASNP